MDYNLYETPHHRGLLPLSRLHAPLLPRLARPSFSPSVPTGSKGGAQHHYPSDLLTLQARRHSVAQPARLDSLARFARSLASPRPRRRPLHPYPAPRRPSSLNSLNSLGSIRSLVDILTASSSSSAARRPHSARPAPYARRHFTGVVGGRTPTPRRPNLTCPPTCWV